MKTEIQISPFALAYIGCALWSSNDESTPAGGEPFDSNYSRDDIAPEALACMVREADEFHAANRADIDGAGLSDERAGFCFWLNRNGHGSGFWDEFSAGDEPGYSLCQSLSAASKKAGERDLYLGDDGKIHQS